MKPAHDKAHLRQVVEALDLDQKWRAAMLAHISRDMKLQALHRRFFQEPAESLRVCVEAMARECEELRAKAVDLGDRQAEAIQRVMAWPIIDADRDAARALGKPLEALDVNDRAVLVDEVAHEVITVGGQRLPLSPSP